MAKMPIWYRPSAILSVPGARCAGGSEGASSSSGDRLFELDLGGEAVAITPDRRS
jgi:hypothetical protein